MQPTDTQNSSRRDFLKTTGRIAAVSALAGVAIPHVHAAEDNTIRLALVGCGGRGTGAVANALSVENGPIKLYAMADAFEDKLNGSLWALQKDHADGMDVPKERQFLGFDAYQNAMDCLRPGDIAVFACPAVFRWVHFDYAIKKGLNVFMEKPFSVDGPTTVKMLQLADESVKQNVKVAVGLMVRHCRARQALYERIRNGEIGDIISMRAYRMHGPIVGFVEPRKDMTDLEFQVRFFQGFLWSGGGAFGDFYIHQIDECSWMKDACPIAARATGGRHFRGNAVDQNFDSYAVDFTYPDGTRLNLYGRSMTGCEDEFASYAHGTKGLGVISTAWHMPGKCRIFNGQNMSKDNLAWAFPQPEANPYQLEWDDFIDAIRKDLPYNEAKRGAEANLVTNMGRMAAHTGRVITWDDMLHCDHEFAPEVDKLAMDSPCPLPPGADGKYPIPQPGITTKREY